MEPTPNDKDTLEDTLIARCCAGDNDAFRPLMLRHQRLAFSVAYRMLGARADAEDVVQQAFVDAFDALGRFTGEGRAEAFRRWLLRIVINGCKDVLKSKRRTDTPLDEAVDGGENALATASPDPEAVLAQAQRRAALHTALHALPIKYREALILKDVEDLPYEEMRAILRLPITTLKIRVVRARAMMRTLLEQGRP